MKQEIRWLLTKRFSIAMALTTAIQLLLAFAMIHYAQEGFIPSMRGEDTAACYDELLDEGGRSDAQSRSELASLNSIGMPAQHPLEPEVRLLKPEVRLLKPEVCVPIATM